MKHSFYLMVFAVCLAVEWELGQAAPPPMSAMPEDTYINLKPLKRVVRQMPPPMPPPPDMPQPPPEMMPPPMPSMLREKREAKGGGSMPTRKG